MNSRTKISTIIGSAVLLATILIFVLVHPVIFPSTVLGLVFLLYSEIVFFGGMVLVEYWASKFSNIMTRAGMGITIGTYAIIVFITSIIYMCIHIIAYRGFLILQIFLLVCVVAICIVFAVASKNRARNDSKVLKTDAMIRNFVDDLELVREQTDKKASVDKLVEALKYSDSSTMVNTDVELDGAILELKNTVSVEKIDELKFDENINKIEFLIKKRNLQTRSEKRGGI